MCYSTYKKTQIFFKNLNFLKLRFSLSFPQQKALASDTVHCPENNLNIRIKTEPVTLLEPLHVWFQYQMQHMCTKATNNSEYRCIRSRL